MITQTQPRRYLTRARAQATDSTEFSMVDESSTTTSTHQRNTRSITGGKRKALAESTLALENSRSKPANAVSSAGASAATRRSIKSIKKSGPSSKAKANGLNGALRRSGRTNDGSKTDTIYVKMECAHMFAHDSKEDKENNSPIKQSLSPVNLGLDDSNATDVLMSTSMGALSVKPQRIPKSHLQLPSTGKFREQLPTLSPQRAIRPIQFFKDSEDPAMEDELSALTSPKLPALSPLKVRRPTRFVTDSQDPAMEDELSSPSSPKLSRTPIRPMRSIVRKNIGDGANLLMSTSNHPLKSSVLYGSPAQRIVPSPSKSRDPSLSLSPTKSIQSLSTRKQGSGGRLGPSISKPPVRSLLLKHSTSLENGLPVEHDDPFLSDPSPARRLFVSENTDDEPFILLEGKNLNFNQPLVCFSTSTTQETPKVSIITNERKSADAQNTVSNVTNTSKTTSDESFPRDEDGDISMDRFEGCPSSMPLSPVAAIEHGPTHRAPSEGGSSFGLFGMSDFMEDEMDDDSENVPPPPQETTIASYIPKFGGAEQGNRRRNSGRGFGQEIECSSSAHPTQHDIPVDPMLLSEGISDIVISYSDAHLHSITVSGNCPDGVDDDDVFSYPNATPRTSSRFDACARNVLAGAVIFVDVHQQDGSCKYEVESTLRRLGAKILRQWSWNPNSTAPGKIGITHVVFKNGSSRTLQKIKASNGLVTCVGLEWVVECSELHCWADESGFVYDFNETPRGGSSRRQPIETETDNHKISNSPSRENTSSQLLFKSSNSPPKTPVKSSGQPFPQTLSPHMNPIISRSLKEKILLAKHRSLPFAPKVGSPLAKVWCAE